MDRVKYMKNQLGQILPIGFALVIIAAIAYGGFKLERWYHYKFGYQSKVQEEVQKAVAPLEKRVTDLEQRLKQLEEKK